MEITKTEVGHLSLVDYLENGLCLSYKHGEEKQIFMMRGDITTLGNRLAIELVNHPVLVDIIIDALKISQRLRADELTKVETDLKKYTK